VGQRHFSLYWPGSCLPCCVCAAAACVHHRALLAPTSSRLLLPPPAECTLCPTQNTHAAGQRAAQAIHEPGWDQVGLQRGREALKARCRACWQVASSLTAVHVCVRVYISIVCVYVCTHFITAHDGGWDDARELGNHTPPAVERTHDSVRMTGGPLLASARVWSFLSSIA